jgi:hypothetical protein
MATLLGQGCTAISVNGNIFVVLWMWLKEQLSWSVCTSKRYILQKKKIYILTLNIYLGNLQPLFCTLVSILHV